MDELTKRTLFKLAEKYPGSIVFMTHQFLDGFEGKACGYVPNEIIGQTVTLTGQWWKSDTPANIGEVND